MSLKPGWYNYNGISNPPAIGKVNGILTFRGAMNGTSGGTTHAFDLPAGFMTENPNSLNIRIVLANDKGGALVIQPDFFFGGPTQVHVVEDGYGLGGPPGPNAFFTSLDGATVDWTASDATGIVLHDSDDLNWTHEYGHRHQYNEEYAVTAKSVGGFVRLQGFLKRAQPNGSLTSTWLFNLPSQFRPGQYVYVPVVLCPKGNGSVPQTYGRINIYPSGDVHVQPENGAIASAKCGVSFEGVAYALTQTTQTLNFKNGWVPYSARQVRVRNSGGVVRFQGAVKNGTAQIIADNLPTSMRPPVNVYLQADSWGAARARIVVTPAGVISFNTPALSVAQGFLSLDGLSYGLP